MPTPTRITASGTVDASPAEVFRIVTDPAMHVAIDGSGMLQAAPDARRLEAVGDTFEMDMDATALGNATIGKYQVLNTVTKILSDQVLEWSVGSNERGGFGHVYGWEIASDGAGEDDGDQLLRLEHGRREAARPIPHPPGRDAREVRPEPRRVGDPGIARAALNLWG